MTIRWGGRPVTTLRGWFALALLTGVYLITVGSLVVFAAMVVAGSWLMWAYANGTGDSPGPGIALLLGAVPVLMAILAGLFAMRRATRPHLAAIPVGPAEAPRLWQLIDELAEQVGTAAPAEIMLTTEANAAVTDNTRLLGLLPGHRCLYLGIPVLAGLSMAELRALLGHELGHYAGRHARLTALIYRGYLAIDGITENLRATSGFAHRLVISYAGTYARLSYAVRRRQELEADRTAVRLAGRAAAADALRAVHALRPIWQEFEDNYLRPALEAGQLPNDPVAAFAAVLRQPDCRDALRELKAAEPVDPPQRPFDSHPGLATRLRELARCADVEPPVAAAEPPPSSWPWTDLGGLFIADLDHVHTVDVSVWLRLVARLRAPAAPTVELLDAAEDLTDGEATLDTVLDLLAAGRGWELAVAMADDATDERRALARLGDALLPVLAHALVGAGCGHWRLRWARPSELIVDVLSASGVHSSDSTQLAEEVFAAVGRRGEVDRLRFHLIALGFNADARLTVEKARPRRLRVRQGDLDQERRDRRNVLVSGVISLAVAAVVLLFGFGQRASMSPPSTNTGYSVVPLTNARQGVPPPTLSTFLPDLSTTITVHAGQTLAAVATCYRTTVDWLRRENNIPGSTEIQAGATLRVPIQLVPPRC